MKSKQELKRVFENGDKPRQEDFWEWQDSYWHKEDSIPIEKIEELEDSLDSKANVDASNINTETWQSKLDLDQKILTSIDGLNYTWLPTNRTLTLSDGEGNQISQVSLLSLDNEGTDLRYNSSTTSLELWNADNELLDSIPVSSFIGSVGTQLQLNSNQLQLKDSQGNILSTVSFAVSNINGLQTVLDGKLNKPSTIGNTTSYPYVIGEDGSGNSARLPAGDLGKNFFNADLSNTSARNHTMNAGITVNTLGNLYALKGLLDKTNNATYSKKLTLNPTTGEVVIKDNADSTDVTNAINNATATQKTSMRTALLGTATPANPVLLDAAPRFTTRGTIYVDLYGLNLTLLEPTFIWIEKADGTKIYASNFYNLTGTAVASIWELPNDLPNGDYPVKIQNGVTIQGLSTAIITVVDGLTETSFPNSDWIIRKRRDSNNVEVTNSATITTSDNYTAIIGKTNGYLSNESNIHSGLVKSQNILLGNKDWDLEMNFIEEDGGGPGGIPRSWIGLTETTHANLGSIPSMINNTIIIYHNQYGRYRTWTPFSPAMDRATHSRLYIVKQGNKIFTRLSNPDNQYSVYLSQQTIDTSKDYAIFFQLGNGDQNINKSATYKLRIIN